LHSKSAENVAVGEDKKIRKGTKGGTLLRNRGIVQARVNGKA